MVSVIDIAIILVYMAAMLFVGLFLFKRETLEDFFVNKRKTKLLLLVFSGVSTNVGAGTIIGSVTSAYDTGISFPLLGAFVAAFAWLTVAWFAPRIKNFGDKYRAFSFGDFYGTRYSPKNRLLVGIIIFVAYFLWAAVQFTGLATIATVLTGLSWEISILLSFAVVIAYTTLSGLKGDIYTDAIQFSIMFLVLLGILLPLSLAKVGGLAAFSSLPASFFDPFAFFGGPIFSLIAFIIFLPFGLVSVEIWQRIYAATDARTARKAMIISGFLNVPFFIAAAIFGMSAFILYPNIDRDFALFQLMKDVLPVGFLGLGFAGILATLMSTVDSLIVVGASALLKDIYISFINPKVSDEKALKLARLFALGFGTVAAVTAYIIADILQLLLASVMILLVFLPSVLGGFLWKRSTSAAAFWSILIGFVVAIIATLQIPNYAFFPAFAASLIIFVILSFVTKHSPTEKIKL